MGCVKLPTPQNVTNHYISNVKSSHQMTSSCATTSCKQIQDEIDLLKKENLALVANSEKTQADLAIAQNEKETYKGKFEILKKNYDTLAIEAKKHQDVACIALQDANKPLNASPSAVYQDLYIKPLCSNPECKKKHDNYVKVVQDYNDAAEGKKKYFDMLDTTIKRNVEQSKSNKIRDEYVLRKFQQQEEAKIHANIQYEMLNRRYHELQQMKTDPLCRDGEIIKLRNELATANNKWMERNATCVKANQEAVHYYKCYEQQSSMVNDMKIEIKKYRDTIAFQNETIEAYKAAQPEELRKCPVGVCTDLRCKRNIILINDTVYAAQNESQKKDVIIRELKEERDRFKQNSVYWKQQHDTLANGSNSDGAQTTTHKRAREEISVADAPKSRELQAKLTDDLETRFRILFDVTNYCGAGMEENRLYDSFFSDQPEKERLDVLEELFSVCHDGNKMPERDRKKYKHDLMGDPSESSRIGKRSFAACLKALGGISKRKNNTIYWINVEMHREPMFMRTQLN